MPTNLTGSSPASTFDQLLHVDGGLTATLKTVYDGDGTASSFQISTGAVSIDSLTVTTGLAVTGSITVTGTVDGRDVAADGTKLDGIESNATADQTGAEIKTAYEAEANTNAFTDAEKSKLTAIEASATADQTGAEIKTAYEAEANTNAFTDAEKSKLTAIESNATADQTQEEIQDAAWAAVSSGTQTLITVTYQDATNNVDFVVDNNLANYSNATSGFITDVTGDPLSALSDVTITSNIAGEILKWNGSAWINNTLAEAGIAATSHAHEGTEILSTGEVGGTKFLREDGDGTCSWQTVSAGGGSVDTVSGTADRISVGGTAADPVVDIAPTYVGQSSITTLGTVTTGTWSATDIAVAAGGTGASTASGARTNLGLVIGTDVQAQDAGLQSISGLTTAADKLIYTTASDTYAVTDLTAQARALLDDTTQLAQAQTILNNVGVTAATISGTDKILGLDVNDSGNLKSFTAQSIADLGGAGGGIAWSDLVDADIVPDTGGTRDLGATATRFAETYTDALNVTNNIIVGGTVDGRDIATDGTKLDGIEASADVTDATNVDAAGAVMNSDTSTSAMSFVVDEDDMTSDSATKVPTQQSVKAYIDTNSGLTAGQALSLNFALG